METFFPMACKGDVEKHTVQNLMTGGLKQM